MSFATVLRKYLSGQETGQLVVQFTGVENLCKISIENGQAVYLSLGTLGPEKTFDFLRGKTALKAKFIAGVTARKRLVEPLNDALYVLADVAGTLGRKAPTGLTAATLPQANTQEIDAVIDEFIDIIGPLGRILAEKALVEIGSSPGTVLTGEQFALFLDAVSVEIPADQQEDFLARCRAK